MHEIQIENRKIGLNYPPLVIVEIGINHEGSLKTAFEMVDAAWKAGAEVIKHQTHVVEDEMSKAAKDVIPGNASVSIYEIMQRCALNEEDEIKLKEYVESKGMIFMSTPFSRAAADRLQKMGVSSYKIGSGECNNYPLIEHIASFGKPMIVSTGMNDIESVRKTVNILEKYNIPYALLHTTNLYPTPVHLVRLGAMQELQKEFPNAKLFFKEGNHCLRWSRYLRVKAPIVLDMEEFRIDVILKLRERGIEWIPNKTLVKIGKLNAIHGNEYKGCGGINVARTLWLRAGDNVIAGDKHKTQSAIKTNIDKKTVGTWSVGCMCELNPDYMPFNEWNVGFAQILVEPNGNFQVRNYMVIDGKIA